MIVDHPFLAHIIAAKRLNGLRISQQPAASPIESAVSTESGHLTPIKHSWIVGHALPCKRVASSLSSSPGSSLLSTQHAILSDKGLIRAVSTDPPSWGINSQDMLPTLQEISVISLPMV